MGSIQKEVVPIPRQVNVCLPEHFDDFYPLLGHKPRTKADRTVGDSFCRRKRVVSRRPTIP